MKPATATINYCSYNSNCGGRGSIWMAIKRPETNANWRVPERKLGEKAVSRRESLMSCAANWGNAMQHKSCSGSSSVSDSCSCSTGNISSCYICIVIAASWKAAWLANEVCPVTWTCILRQGEILRIRHVCQLAKSFTNPVLAMDNARSLVAFSLKVVRLYESVGVCMLGW